MCVCVCNKKIQNNKEIKRAQREGEKIRTTSSTISATPTISSIPWVVCLCLCVQYTVGVGFREKRQRLYLLVHHLVPLPHLVHDLHHLSCVCVCVCTVYSRNNHRKIYVPPLPPFPPLPPSPPLPPLESINATFPPKA